MPVRLPAPLIHLLGVLRPRLLRPDVRTPSIVNVDWAGLQAKGFNAVVIDKDNCLTLPHHDNIFPQYATAWANLKATFPPGRVLLVSNSAGSSKDRGGIGAEALSLSLGAPVLAHARPKPACASDIISYFNGALGAPRTRRAAVSARAQAAAREEQDAERDLLDRWRDEVSEGPLCGEFQRPEEAEMSLEEKMVAANKRKPEEHQPRQRKAMGEQNEPTTGDKGTVAPEVPAAPLRILVVGDRLFTDTLLARRLALHLPKPEGDPLSVTPSTLSIKTTRLPLLADVRPLRWIEEKLAGKDYYRANDTRWEKYILPDAPVPVVPKRDISLLALARRLEATDGRAALDPRTWRPWNVAGAAVRGADWVLAMAALGVRRGAAWSWVRMRAWGKEQKGKFVLARQQRKEAARVAREKAAAEAAVEAEKATINKATTT